MTYTLSEVIDVTASQRTRSATPTDSRPAQAAEPSAVPGGEAWRAEPSAAPGAPAVFGLPIAEQVGPAASYHDLKAAPPHERQQRIFNLVDRAIGDLRR